MTAVFFLIFLVAIGSVAFAAVSFLGAVLLRPLVLRLGIFSASSRVPLWGGLAFMAPIAILAFLLLGEGGGTGSQLTVLLLGLVALVVFGLLDDIAGLLPLPQLVFQGIVASLVVAGIVLPRGGEGVTALPIASLVVGGGAMGSIAPVVLGTGVFAVLFFIASLNAINWIDGIDGLASATGAAALGGAGVAAFSFGLAYTGIFLVLSGAALVGFFAFNKPPARLYMGTAGSMGIGFVVASVSLFQPALIPVFLALLALPFGDAILVLIKRLYARRSPFRGDRRHLHYQLLDAGWSEHSIIALYIGSVLVSGGVLMIFGATLYAGAVAVGGGFLLSLVLNIFFGPLVAPSLTDKRTRPIVE